MRTASTSKAALEVVRPRISALEESILETISGTVNITTEELAAELEVDVRTVAARVSELRRDGLLRASAEKRPTKSGVPAHAWELGEEDAPVTIEAKRLVREAGLRRRLELALEQMRLQAERMKELEHELADIYEAKLACPCCSVEGLTLEVVDSVLKAGGADGRR